MKISIKYIALCLMSIMTLMASAYDFISDGIAYHITSFTELKCAVVKADEPYKGIIIIPNSVTFNGKELEVTEIGSVCFENCTELTKVVFNDKIEEIGSYAFSGCGLDEISIPNSVKSIDSNAFQGCESLVSINLPQDIKYVPKGYIRDCPLVKSFIIPENVETIEISAFEGCKNLQKIIIPASVTTIEDNVFNGCGLKDIIFCNSDKTLFLGTSKSYRTGMGWKEHTVYRGLFEMCTLENVTLGRNLEYKCELDFRIKGSGNQEKYLDIWYPPFHYQSLKNLTITSTLNYLPKNLLYGCSLKGNLVIDDCSNNLKIYPIDYYIEESGKENHYNYNNLNNLSPENIYIGRNLDFYIPQGSKIYPWKLKTDNVTEIKFSDFVTKIDEIKLQGTKEKLTHIYIGNKVEEINYSQFEAIPNLNNLYLGESIQKIGYNAFRNCSSLKDIILPQSLRTIDNRAFEGCPITTLKLPSNIRSISTAFNNCNLDSIYIESPNPPSSSGYSNNIYLYCKLFVPYGKIDLYKNSDPWANFWNIEEFGDDSSVENIYEDRQRCEINRFDVNGNIVDDHYKGFVIVRYSDGSTKKIIQE